ncbi:hypothetical protein TWF217_003297 [Orbilia oligospora]|nr:hypothetical protein TWF217_003297 [Orbilia oligospora]
MSPPDSQAKKKRWYRRSFFGTKSGNDSSGTPKQDNITVLQSDDQNSASSHGTPIKSGGKTRATDAVASVFSVAALGVQLPNNTDTTYTTRPLSGNIPAATGNFIIAGNSPWAEAINKLPKDERELLVPGGQSIDSGEVIVNNFISEIEGLRDKQKSQEWKIEIGERKIILRDISEKIIVWLKTFKEVGDIAVQYDPVHAALPWAGVRFMLQMAISNSEARDAILIGTEQVIWMIGRYAAHEKMYLGFNLEFEESLKKSLVNFYGTIIQFLIKSKRFFDRSKIESVAKAVFPSTYSKELDSLQKAEANAMKDVEVARSQKNNWSNKSNSEMIQKLTEPLNEFDEPISRIDEKVGKINDMLDDEKRGQALEWASPINHNQDHNYYASKITPGTCSWLHRNEDFLNWRKSSSSSIFWLTGNAGCGKTVLTASVVRSLLDEGRGSSSHDCVAYFYCDAKSNKSMTDTGRVLGSLLKQMATLRSGHFLQLPIAEEFQQRIKSGNTKSPPTFEEAKALISKIAGEQLYPSISIAIDALDECQDGPEGRRMLIKMLIELARDSNCLVKIFLSSRPSERDINLSLKDVPSYHIKLEDTSADVGFFIDSKMQEYEDGGLFLPEIMSKEERERLKIEVSQKLKEKCQGMFLWAQLQIESICDCDNESQLRSYLFELPVGLRSTYKYILDRIKEKDKNALAASTAFRWMIGSLRQLRPREILGAVRERTNIAFSIKSFLDVCRNLLVFDEENQVFRFVHLSFLEFLQMEDGHFPGVSFQKQDCIESVTVDCFDFFESTDERCTHFDPPILTCSLYRFFYAQTTYKSLNVYDTSNYEDCTKCTSLNRTKWNRLEKPEPEHPPFLEFSVFVWTEWAIQLGRCTNKSPSFCDRVKNFLGTHISPSEALKRLVEYSALLSEHLKSRDNVSFAKEHGYRINPKPPNQILSTHLSEQQACWYGLPLWHIHKSFRTKDGAPSPLFLALYLDIGWYIEWLNALDGTLFQYMASDGRPLPFSCLFNASPSRLSPWEWEFSLCNEFFERVVTLPGFSITAFETADFLYLALNVWINTVSDFRGPNPVAAHNWVQCIQTQAKKQEILLSWLIYSRTDPGDNNRFGAEHYSLTRYLPTCPLYIFDLLTRLRVSRRDWIYIDWLRFWLDNGVDPNRVGTWGTLGHFITGVFLGDFGLQKGVSSARWRSELRISGSEVDEDQSRAKECLVLLKSYNADLNLRHPITHETIFEYACRLLYTSLPRTVELIKAFIEFAPLITITKYALICAIHLDKRHAAQERHEEFAGFGEQPPRRLSDLLSSELKHKNFVDTASRDELSLGSLEHALKILEKGLDPKDWDEFYDFYAKGVELPEDLPFEFWTRHISKTIPENLYTFKRTSDELDSLDPFHVSAGHLTEKYPFDQLVFMMRGRQAKIVLKYISCCTHDKGKIGMAASVFGSLKGIEQAL